MSLYKGIKEEGITNWNNHTEQAKDYPSFILGHLFGD